MLHHDYAAPTRTCPGNRDRCSFGASHGAAWVESPASRGKRLAMVLRHLAASDIAARASAGLGTRAWSPPPYQGKRKEAEVW